MRRLYSTGNSTQCSVVTYMGRESKREGKYVHIYTCVCVCVYVCMGILRAVVHEVVKSWTQFRDLVGHNVATEQQ